MKSIGRDEYKLFLHRNICRFKFDIYTKSVACGIYLLSQFVDSVDSSGGRFLGFAENITQLFFIKQKNQSEMRGLHYRVKFPDLAMKGFCAIRLLKSHGLRSLGFSLSAGKKNGRFNRKRNLLDEYERL